MATEVGDFVISTVQNTGCRPIYRILQAVGQDTDGGMLWINLDADEGIFSTLKAAAERVRRLRGESD